MENNIKKATRREFIQKTTVAGAALMLSGSAQLLANKKKRLQ